MNKSEIDNSEILMPLNMNAPVSQNADEFQKRASIVTKLRKSPMFQLSLSSKELFHSNFLYWIWQVSPTMFQYMISQLFMKAGRPIDHEEWPEYYEVHREYNNFDLCVISKNDESDKQGKVRLVVENKVKSIPRLSQLKEYFKF